MAKNKVLQAVVSFAGSIDPSLGKALDDVTGKLDKVNWKAVAVGGAVGGIAVATGKAVVDAGKYLADLGNEYNTALNQLSAATGTTGDELAALIRRHAEAAGGVGAGCGQLLLPGQGLLFHGAVGPGGVAEQPALPAAVQIGGAGGAVEGDAAVGPGANCRGVEAALGHGELLFPIAAGHRLLLGGTGLAAASQTEGRGQCRRRNALVHLLASCLVLLPIYQGNI